MAFGDVVQSNSGTSSTATTTPTLPGATTAGNIIVLTIASDDYNGTPNSGWTQSSECEQQTFHGGYVWWAIATASMTIPSYTIGSAVRSAWTLVEYEGPFDASPYDVSEGQFSTSSASSYATPNATPTSGDRLLVAGVQFQNGASDLTLANTPTNSFTSRRTVLYNGANPRLTLMQSSRVVTANGSTAYSTGAQINPSSFNSATGILIAFKKGASGGTSTGTLSATLGAATLAATGKTLASGSLSATLGAATLAATGKTLATGTLAATLGNATLAASGTVANQVFTGTLAVTLGDATLSATGKSLARGTLAATLGDATLAASGSIGTLVSTGTLAVTLGNATLLATGTAPLPGITGTLAATLDNATLAATGKALARGTLTATLGDATLAGTGLAPRPVSTGTLAVTLASATLTGRGNVGDAVGQPSSVCLTALWPGTRVLLTGYATGVPLVAFLQTHVVMPWQPISRCTQGIPRSSKSVSRHQPEAPSTSQAPPSASSSPRVQLTGLH